MRRIVLLLAFSVVATASAFASITTCPTGSYSQYLAPGFTCTSGALLFSNFGYAASANPSAIAIPATAIQVTPITTDLNEGFQFADGWNVGTQQGGAISFQDSLVSFEVSTRGASISDLHLFFNGAFTGTGLSGVTENFCLNHMLSDCPAGSSGQLHVTNPPPGFNDFANFAPVSSIFVSKDINVSSGTNGTASISQVINTFSQVPEPMSFVLLGSGLLGLGLIRKRLSR